MKRTLVIALLGCITCATGLRDADEMVGTGPLRMTRTQKNEVVSPVGSFTNGEQR